MGLNFPHCQQEKSFSLSGWNFCGFSKVLEVSLQFQETLVILGRWNCSLFLLPTQCQGPTFQWAIAEHLARELDSVGCVSCKEWNSRQQIPAHRGEAGGKEIILVCRFGLPVSKFLRVWVTPWDSDTFSSSWRILLSGAVFVAFRGQQNPDP